MRQQTYLKAHFCHARNRYDVGQALSRAFYSHAFAITTSVFRLRTESATAPLHTAAGTSSETAGAALRDRPVTLRPPASMMQPNYDGDVIVDDLSATLEAHRTTNRASVLRLVEAETDNPSEGESVSLSLPNKLGRNGARAQLETHVKGVSLEDKLKRLQTDTASTVGAPGESSGQHDPQQAAVKWRKLETSNENRLRFLFSRSVRNQRIGEYRGEAVYPVQQWATKGGFFKTMERPWLERLDADSDKGDGLTRLKSEILAFHAYICPTPEETAAYQKLTGELQQYVHESLPGRSLETIGSHLTGLATSLSDLDFQLRLPEFEKPAGTRGPSPTRPKAIKQSIRELRILGQTLYSSGKFDRIDLRRARIPIVAAVHKATQLPVQIQTMSDTSTSQAYMFNYLAEYPSLFPLYTVIKTMLEIRGLRDVYTGGLSGYSIFMMVVAALKRSVGPIQRDDLARQLMHFLRLYAHKLNLYEKGLSIEPPQLFDKVGGKPSTADKEASTDDPVLQGRLQIARIKEEQPYLLCLQDPANPLNDLGSKSYAIKHVQHLFGDAVESMARNLRTWGCTSPSQAKSSHWRTVSMLDYAVGADYRWFEQHRERVAAYAR